MLIVNYWLWLQSSDGLASSGKNAYTLLPSEQMIIGNRLHVIGIQVLLLSLPLPPNLTPVLMV